jgi:single-strand DNA-binding protein
MQAETASQYLRKGQLALVEGRLRTTSWEVEGGKRYRTDIVAERIQFGPKRQEDANDTDDYPSSGNSAAAASASRDESVDGQPDGQQVDGDIPF